MVGEPRGPRPNEFSLNPGEFLFHQGEVGDDVYILRTGRLEVLIVEDEERPSIERILDDSRRIAVIDSPGAPIGEIGAIRSAPRTASIRAMEYSRLGTIPARGEDFREWIADNRHFALLIARAMGERFTRSSSRLAELKGIASRILQYIENYSLVYALLVPLTGADPTDDEVYARGEEILSDLESAGDRPSAPSPALLERRREGTEETIGGATSHLLDDDLCRFLAAFVSRPIDELRWIEEGDASNLLFVTERLASSFPVINTETREVMRRIEALLVQLAGEPGSVSSAFIDLSADPGDIRGDRVISFLRRLKGTALDLEELALENNIRPPDSFLSALAELQALDKDEETGKKEITASAEGGEIGSILDALSSISSIPSIEREAFVKLVEEGLADDKSRDLAVKIYWQLVPHVFLANLAERRPEFSLFLRYGLAFREPVGSSLPPEYNLDPQTGQPVLFLDDWLGMIHSGDIPTSSTELSKSYSDIISRKDRGGKYDPDENDPDLDLVKFEVFEVAAPAARMASAGHESFIPLCIDRDEALSIKPIEPGAIAGKIIDLLKTDFSLFYREVRTVISERSDFLQREVLPRFLLIPSMGERGMTWQAFEGRSKSSPGRIFFPVRTAKFIDDISLDTMGHFRWELARSAAGISWMDPVDGGLTGRYFDYITYYRKNPDLSDEAKARIGETFRGALTDADKFTSEYIQWIRFESRGSQRLNRVSRRIFTEFVPFPRSIRERLAKHPAYADLIRKDSIKRAKKRQELERKIQKYQMKGLDIGDAFNDSLRFYDPLPID